MRAPGRASVAVWCLAATGAAGWSGTAQAIDQELGSWLAFNVSDQVPWRDPRSPWRLRVNGEVRFPDYASDQRQYVFQPGVFRTLDWREGASGGGGYARIRTRTSTGAVVTEDRLYWQLGWTLGEPVAAGRTTLRLRWLQRWSSTGGDLRHTLRARIGFSFPRGGLGSGREWQVTLEPWLDLARSDWGGGAGISQARGYAGVGWRVGDGSRLDVGYLAQHLRRARGENDLRHLLAVTWSLRR